MTQEETKEMAEWVILKQDELDDYSLKFMDDMERQDWYNLTDKQEKFLIKLFDKHCGR